MTYNLFALFATTAVAYNWGIGPAGNNGNYHFESGSFTADEEDQIVKGADAWDAGAGEVLRGADWDWWQDSDVANGVGGNFRDEVYMRDQAWFNMYYMGSFIAATVPGIGDTDIMFKSSVTWSTALPSSTLYTSIGQVAAHEFGHRIGFDHEDDNIALMNSSYPNGGDISAIRYRIHEDDSVGLQDHKTDSSTGKDLMLSKFSYEGSGHSEERWDLPWTYSKSSAAFVGGGPGLIMAIIEGTGGSVSPFVEWRVVAPTEACFDGIGTEYIVGNRTPIISPNVPYPIGPNSWNFSSVPTGIYELCAKIDAYDTITETDFNEIDNNLRSESTLTVIP